MNKRYFGAALPGLFAILIIGYSCTKIDTTTLGSDVIPIVDNVNTFADTLDITSTQHIFDDTVRIFRTENHLLGKTTDPLFGQTTASMFFEMKPAFFPYFFGQTLDTIIGLDSVVLSLSYKAMYGDSTIAQTLEVSEVALNTGGLWDSVYQSRPLSYEPTTNGILGSKTVDIRDLKNTVKFANGRDSSTNQIRIKLSYARMSQIFLLDSTRNGGNNGFFNDSVFKTKFRGFGVRSVGAGNALMYINLNDAESRLEFHYRKRKNNIVDTTYSTFRIVNGISQGTPTVTANHVVRSRPPYVLNTPASEIYLQTTPGTYALLKVDSLDSFKRTNRIVHRAEIFMQQLPDNFITDSIFPAPNFLYLDLKDTTTALNYKPIYYDLNPGVFYNPDNGNGVYYPVQIDFATFGGYQRRRTDEVTRRSVAYYNFNVTRYVQRMLINNSTNYTMRLFSPYSILYPQYSTTVIPYNNSLAFGRLKVGGGSHPVHPMKMVIIWSKIK